MAHDGGYIPHIESDDEQIGVLQKPHDPGGVVPFPRTTLAETYLEFGDVLGEEAGCEGRVQAYGEDRDGDRMRGR